MTRQTLTAPPSEIRLSRAQKTLKILWPDGLSRTLNGITLRKACACSGCTRSKQAGALTLIDAGVQVDKIEMHGISGLQLFFSDGHDRGLYPWAYLRELCERV